MNWRITLASIIFMNYINCSTQSPLLCTELSNESSYGSDNSKDYSYFSSTEDTTKIRYIKATKLLSVNSFHPTTESNNSSIQRWDVFYWDKMLMTPLQYQNSYCQRRCKDGEAVSYNSNSCLTVTCTDCECRRPACEIYNNCCPNFSEEAQQIATKAGDPFPYGISRVKEGVDFEVARNHSKHPVLGCEEQPNYTFLYIKSCPPEYSEHPDFRDTISLCEDDLPADQETVDTFIRVYDNLTRAVYRNKFCAECNNVQQVVPILTEITCTNYMSLYTASNTQELLRLQLISNLCSVRMSPPEDVIMTCELTVTGEQIQIQDTCDSDITGLEVDDDVIIACSELTGNSYSVFDTFNLKYYRNIFCAICNQKSYPYVNLCLCAKSPHVWPTLPFSLLLNFRREQPSTESDDQHNWLIVSANCSVNEWASPNSIRPSLNKIGRLALQCIHSLKFGSIFSFSKWLPVYQCNAIIDQTGQCFQLKCVPGKMLQNESCVPIFPEIKGLGYNLRLLFELKSGQPYANSNSSDTITRALLNTVKALLLDLSNEYSLNITTETQKIQSSNLTGAKLYVINMNIIARPDLSRQEFELAMIDSFLDRFIDKNFTYIENKRPLSYQIIYDALIWSNCALSTNFTNKTTAWFVAKGFLSREDMKPFENHFIRLSKLLTCSYISFNTSAYIIDVSCDDLSPRVTVTLDLSVLKLVFTDPKDMVMMEVDTDDKLNVCQELINREVQRLHQNLKRRLYNTPLSGLDLAEYVITLSCLCVSMICLLLTLMTYFRLGSLRTDAGINNMFLGGSLLLAQISLLASSHLQGPSVLCTVLGVSTHFLWLWMFTWTLICSFHMFRVFTAKVRASVMKSKVECVDIFRKLFVTLLLPLLVVITVVLSSYYTSQDIGYGKVKCYLNSNFLVGVSMIGPLAVILVSNTVLFLITIYKIYVVRSMLSSDCFKKDDRKNLLVYFKLSSVTGAFWTFYVVAEAVDSDVLRIFAIFLNGLQGVLIFLSYICNKKVLQLLLERLSGRTSERNRRMTRSEGIACQQTSG